MAVVLLGPFQGAERALMLSDKQAHGLAFFVFTFVSFVAAPRIRRGDLALTALALAASSEIAQAVVGCDGNAADFLADAIGIALAVAPSYVGVLRRAARGERPPQRLESDKIALGFGQVASGARTYQRRSGG